MMQRTRDTAHLITCIKKRINPCALEGLCLKIENLISSIAFFTQTTEVNLIGEQQIALSFRLLEVLNQPLLYLWVSFNSSASGSYCLVRHMTTKFLFDHQNLEDQCLSHKGRKLKIKLFFLQEIVRCFPKKHPHRMHG
ncbi:hypothetical protein CHARACLAT_012836 [Characodon lateralis]|uniref:Uncharacterized protein n=1 Tax=Characodon lateralis TaxID=208331 RepID=A0ABU7E041_9TELE|nr:hypothetical protein [Characodon lateralis]